jgi:kynureninase
MLEITDISYARNLDREDPLARFRDEFIIEGDDIIYLDGNSLGRLPRRTKERLRQVVEQEWGERLIRGWAEGWMDLSTRLGAKIARLLGAQDDEILVCDATSINLFKLAMAAINFQQGKYRILTDELNFPSDIYVLQGIVDLLGPPYELVQVSSEDSIGINPENIRSSLDDRTALLCFTHTNFKSSFILDMNEITADAHENNALILWDLSHSVGSVPVELNACNADLAVGCTYKYLNGGPGAPAFLYVRRDLQKKLHQPIKGWLGSKAPFDFNTGFEPADGIQRFQIGTPPILAMSAIESGLDLHLEAGMDLLREKSIRQTAYMIDLFDLWLVPLGFSLGSPRDPGCRGSHLAIQHPKAREITETLIHGGNGSLRVIPDFRQPDNIRLGVAPIYNSFEDLFLGMSRIRELAEKIR